MMQRAGTAFYMAPEMINAGVYDQKADAWGKNEEKRSKTFWWVDSDDVFCP